LLEVDVVIVGGFLYGLLAVDAKTNNSLESLCAYGCAIGAALDRGHVFVDRRSTDYR